MKTDELLNELKSTLTQSTASQRARWASNVIQDEINLKKLSTLLFMDDRISLRFQWLLSHIGMNSKEYLLSVLPYLFTLRNEVTQKDFKTAFATYWSIAGVPEENESQAIELLFQWLNDSKINVTLKSRSMKSLLGLVLKYPDLRNEFRLCIENQMDKYTLDFKRRSQKVLDQITLF